MEGMKELVKEGETRGGPDLVERIQFTFPSQIHHEERLDSLLHSKAQASVYKATAGR